MIIRSKAPLRIGLAGGGTDVSPYSDIYGGAILNATIDLYAYASLEPLDNGKIEFCIDGTDKCLSVKSETELPLVEGFELFIGVYNRIVKEYEFKTFIVSLNILYRSASRFRFRNIFYNCCFINWRFCGMVKIAIR
jgi:D-glycero-alpha-D-manno-heptose-7-phosphate kinase